MSHGTLGLQEPQRRRNLLRQRRGQRARRRRPGVAGQRLRHDQLRGGREGDRNLQLEFRGGCDESGVIPGTQGVFVQNEVTTEPRVRRFTFDPPVRLPAKPWFAARPINATSGIIFAGVPMLGGDKPRVLQRRSAARTYAGLPGTKRPWWFPRFHHLRGRGADGGLLRHVHDQQRQVRRRRVRGEAITLGRSVRSMPDVAGRPSAARCP